MIYSRELKKDLCEKICLNKVSTIKTANEFNIPIKTLEKWITAYNKDNHCFDPIIETVTDIKIINNINNSIDYNELSIEDYIHYFNYERPQCALKYLTSMQYKNIYYIK